MLKRQSQVACVHCKTLVDFSMYTLASPHVPDYILLQPGALFASVTRFTAEPDDGSAAFSIACSLRCVEAFLQSPEPLKH